MAEFCLECWNRINETDTEEKMYIISRDLELCEGCGGWKPVIVRLRTRYIIKDMMQNWLHQRRSQ